MDAGKVCAMLLMVIVIAGCSDELPETTIPEPTGTPSITATIPPTITSTGTPVITGTTPATPITIPTTTTAPTTTWNPDGVISDNEYTTSLTVNNGKFVIHWKSANEMIYFGLETTTSGWAAIGFEPTVRMKDADIILGGMADGAPYIYDMFSTGPTGPHPPDTDLGGTFDITTYGVQEQAGGTVVECSRRTDTGDAYDTVLVPGAEITLMWAQADTDEPLMIHNTGRGTEKIIL